MKKLDEWLERNRGWLYILSLIVLGVIIGDLYDAFFDHSIQDNYREVANASFDAGFSSGQLFESCDAARGFTGIGVDCENLSKLEACSWGVAHYLNICEDVNNDL